MLLRVVECHALEKVRVRRGHGAHIHQCPPQSSMRRDEHGSVVSLLHQREELLTECVRRLQLGAYEIMIPQSTPDGEKLVWGFQVCTKMLRTEVGVCHLRNRRTLRGNERCAQGD